MKASRSRLAVLASLVATGCAGILGVPDLTYDANAIADGGTSDGNPGNVTPGADANAACNTDVSLDPRNCGRCGHDCGGGACTAGVCQPVVLASGINVAQQIALDDTYVYVAIEGDDAVKRVKKDGSGALEMLVDAPGTPNGVGVNGTTLYFTTTEGLFACTAGTCAATKHQLSTASFARGIAVNGGNVFFATQSDVRRVLPNDGGDLLLPTNNSQEFAVAANADYVYFTSTSPALQRSLADGGGTDSIDVGPKNSANYGSYVAVDGDRYFWSYKDDANDGGFVYSGSHANTSDLTVYTSTAGYPVGITADANYVYWIDAITFAGVSQETSRLLACPRGGCAGDPILVASGLHGGGTMLLDGPMIYYVENNNFQPGGRISKVAKP